jgi:MFS family permease
MTSTTEITPDAQPNPSWRRDAEVIGLIGFVHGVSHFFHLILAPLFPQLKEAFDVSYAELGLLMSVFFVVSGVGQALSGFIVDRFGARPVLYAGLALFGVSALGLASAQHFAQLLFFSGVAGLGNAVFHPVDYSLLNRCVSTHRMSYAFSVHGLSGTLGWAVAPVFLVGLSVPFGWRGALIGAAVLAFVALLLVLLLRSSLQVTTTPGAAATAAASGGTFDFLRSPLVWACFGFFLILTTAFAGIQSFANTALQMLYAMPAWQATSCITAYMLASAAGTLVGGFLAAKVERQERIIVLALCLASASALLVAATVVPAALVVALVGVIGFGSGIAGPSRDMLVRKASPPGATGRVFGVVYSGLDSGLAIGPLIFGALMDAGHPALIFVGIGVFQILALTTASGVGSASHAHAAQAA